MNIKTYELSQDQHGIWNALTQSFDYDQRLTQSFDYVIHLWLLSAVIPLPAWIKTSNSMTDTHNYINNMLRKSLMSQCLLTLAWQDDETLSAHFFPSKSARDKVKTMWFGEQCDAKNLIQKQRLGGLKHNPFVLKLLWLLNFFVTYDIMFY